MNWNRFDLNFPWIGLAAAVILSLCLFLTDRLRGERMRSQWRDRVWLSWLAVAVYLVHNVEEYGIDLSGRFHAFPSSMCVTLGQPPFPDCVIPPAFFLSVNLPLFWIGAPVAALSSRRHPVIGLSLYGVIFVNALAHLGEFARAGYNPGALTALVLFLPLSVWVAHVCFGKDELPYAALAFIAVEGAVLHVILIGSVKLFLLGALGPAALVTIQILNAALFFLFAWLAERWLIGRTVRT